MKKKIIILSIVFAAVTLACWFHPASEYSESERRQLSQFPEFTTDAVFSGQFASEFESYSLDQFPLREQFRSLKAMAEYDLWRKKDNNDLYLKDGCISKILYPLSEKSVDYAANRFQNVYEKFLKESDGRIFAAVVPDKGYYTAAEGGWPSLDYEALFDMIRTKMPYAQYVDLTGSLKLSDYYRTDSHWRQECLGDAVVSLGNAMGLGSSLDYLKNEKALETKTVLEDFKGVYYGQAALPLPGEALKYAVWDGVENCIVTNYETGKKEEVYQLEKAEGKDPYDIFLGGACALMTVENPSAKAAGIQRELILFRDSFGSSIAPLMLPAYSSITLVDLRYLKGDYLDQFIDFHGQDVLFLYGATLLNESYTLK